MTIEEFNTLVEQAYEAAFEYEQKLIAVYHAAYDRQSELAVKRFESMTAAWTPPEIQSLSDGMSEQEVEAADSLRDLAAEDIMKVFAALGISAFGVWFMRSISFRAQENFRQELLRNLRKIVSDSFAAGLSSEETGAAIRDKFAHLAPASAEMLAQTELTSLVNERSLAAAQKAFPDGVIKTWRTVGDNKVRAAHAAVSGTSVPQDQPFQVGGSSMQYPGDPSAPLRLTARCRCRISFTTDPAPVVASAQEDTLMSTMEETNEPVATAYVKILPDFSSWPTEIGLVSESGTNMGTLTEGDHYTVTAEPHTISSNSNAFSTITITTESTEEEVAAPMEDGPPWRALLAVEGVATEDGRMIAEGALTWRTLPLSLTAMDTSNHGAEGEARVAGRIDNIWRDEINVNEVWGEGVFNSDEFGTHIAELVGNQSLRGNSIEPAVLAYEIRHRETGEVLEGDELYDAMMNDEPLLTVFLEAVIMASTVCATPAIGEANIVLASGVMRTTWFQAQTSPDLLTASAAGMAPLHPRADWFDDPHFTELTPLTVTDDGRVMGHAAGWHTCHLAEPSGPGVCVTPPRSGMGYEVFHHGCVQTEEGHDVSVGHITMSTHHAGSSIGWKAAQDHYDHSGCVVADVRAGEDRHGIWVSGALRPDLSAAKVREFRGGSLSGDWRSVIGRGLELISALVVNVPGYPIPRPSASIVASASGGDEVESLVAAGVVCGCDEIEEMSRREYLRKIRALTA